MRLPHWIYSTIIWTCCDIWAPAGCHNQPRAKGTLALTGTDVGAGIGHAGAAQGSAFKTRKGPIMMNIDSTSIRIGTRDVPPLPGDNSSKFAADQLRALVERIERLEEDKKAVADDIRGIYIEAKGDGYDVKALRALIRMRKMTPEDRAEQEAILDTYMHALGMI
jgi:uncharacterized protein (UPF0335 family)